MTDREKLIELLLEIDSVCDASDCCECCEEGCYTHRAADHLIANGVTFATDTNAGSKWISVEDRLPEPGVVVLVYSKLGCTYFSYILRYHLEGRPFAIEYSGGWEITHWMPMPVPPKEEPK